MPPAGTQITRPVRRPQEEVLSHPTPRATTAADTLSRPHSSRPTFQEATWKIASQTGHTEEQASAAFAVLERAARNGGTYHLTPTDMRSHPTIDAFMSDEATSQVGTAHDLSERALGVTLLHGRTHSGTCVVITARKG